MKAKSHIFSVHGRCFKRLAASAGMLLFIFAVAGTLAACAAPPVTELNISDMDQVRISRLNRYPDLKTLDLRGVDVSEEQVRELSVALPDCSILWRVPIGAGYYDNTVTDLALPADTSPGDVGRLAYFPHLERVDGTACRITEALLAECRKLNSVSFTWEIAGVPIHNGTTKLDFSGCTMEEPGPLETILEYYPNIREVDFTGAIISNESLLSLFERRAQADIVRRVAIAGRTESCWATALELTETDPRGTPDLMDALARFPMLETVDLTGQPFSLSDAERLKDAYPTVEFAFTLEVFSQRLSTHVETIDLSGTPVNTPEEAIRALKHFPRLREVNMCDCGLSDAQMERLTEAFPNVSFVWYIRIGGWKIRTDITAFSKGQRQKFPNGMGAFLGDGKTNFRSDDLAPLKYCRNLEFLDLGHGSWITDLSILSNFPNLRGLILSMNKITDITPLSSLQKLESLEIYQNYITDLSPLKNLPNLTYLNLSRNSFIDVSPLLEMKQLKKLWLVHSMIPAESQAALTAALPGCEIRFQSWGCGSGGWRDNELYYAYQKAFGLPTKP